MLTIPIIVLTAIACVVGLSVAVWSIVTTEKRHRERLRKQKESVSN
ncbi:MAG: hypothetical protein OXH22_11415 [Chloroflexi bacterium]|nr:hypothetical protein [Chloroflexota bacterium]